MKNKLNISALFMTCLMLFSLVVYTSCEKSDDVDTNQMSGEIALNSFGPSPAMRGGELRFIGTNLDQVSSIDLPGAEGITDIKKVSQYEVRITIPQTAQPGYVVLNTSKGEIQTKTPISYQEPISITDFSPKSAKAGDVIKIEGEYLNIIEEIIFADNVHVLKADFVSQSRQVIEVKVPVDAQTGKLIVSDGADILSDGEKIPNWVYSAVDLTVALPEITAVSPKTIKAGQALTITGSLLRLVKSVRFQNADDVNVAQADPTKDITAISVAVPANAKTGAVKLVLLSGVEIAVGDIKLVEPTAAIESPLASYDVNETVVISGTDLDLVTTAAFTGGEAGAVTLTDGKINLKVTAAAQSGAITLTLANGNTLTVDGFVTTKPVATLPADATPLDELSIVSTLGSRVKTVKFGDLEAAATATSDGFKVTVPLAAKSGDVTLVMDNGEIVEAGKIMINSFTFCAIAAFPENEVTAGGVYSFEVVNGSELNAIRLGGKTVAHILVGTMAYIVTDAGQSGNVELVLISKDGTEVPYTIYLAPAGLVETTLWVGERNFNDSGWGVSLTDLQWGKYDFSWFTAGQIITLYYAINADYTSVRCGDGSWGTLPSLGGDFKFPDGSTQYSFKLTAADVETIKTKGGLGVFGYGFVLMKMTVTTDFSPAKVIFDTKTEIGNWGNIQIPATAFSSATVGQVITVVTSDLASDAQGSFKGSDWKEIAAGYEYFDITGDFKLTITEDILAKLKSGGLIVSGKNYSVVKVTLK